MQYRIIRTDDNEYFAGFDINGEIEWVDNKKLALTMLRLHAEAQILLFEIQDDELRLEKQGAEAPAPQGQCLSG